ncbi:hypothetical protein DPMN_020860 [Dreissena polymorpha]|uniref:Uncharacterized protein n=2 Tax=Dreissena polymorpha TaxID=45954 RepID=A0A9D4NN94_DREPO|nr:hypothetical protein DPMN_020860 [Dreissena polymorpha]
MFQSVQGLNAWTKCMCVKGGTKCMCVKCGTKYMCVKCGTKCMCSVQGLNASVELSVSQSVKRNPSKYVSSEQKHGQMNLHQMRKFPKFAAFSHRLQGKMEIALPKSLEKSINIRPYGDNRQPVFARLHWSRTSINARPTGRPPYGHHPVTKLVIDDRFGHRSPVPGSGHRGTGTVIGQRSMAPVNGLSLMTGLVTGHRSMLPVNGHRSPGTGPVTGHRSMLPVTGGRSCHRSMAPVTGQQGPVRSPGTGHRSTCTDH